MSEKPILFSAEMVRAILSGSKSQTRRVINRVNGIGPVTEFQRSDTPGYDFIMRDREMRWNDLRAADAVKRSPKGQRGDRLWVQESYRIEGAGTSGNRCRYLADDTTRLTEDLWDADSMEKWSKRQFPFRPSPGRFMYRCLSRIDLE